MFSLLASYCGSSRSSSSCCSRVGLGPRPGEACSAASPSRRRGTCRGAPSRAGRGPRHRPVGAARVRHHGRGHSDSVVRRRARVEAVDQNRPRLRRPRAVRRLDRVGAVVRTRLGRDAPGDRPLAGDRGDGGDGVEPRQDAELRAAVGGRSGHPARASDRGAPSSAVALPRLKVGDLDGRLLHMPQHLRAVHGHDASCTITGRSPSAAPPPSCGSRMSSDGRQRARDRDWLFVPTPARATFL